MRSGRLSSMKSQDRLQVVDGIRTLLVKMQSRKWIGWSVANQADLQRMKRKAEDSISQAAESAPDSFEEAKEQAQAGVDVPNPKDSEMMPGAGDNGVGKVVEDVKDKVSDAVDDVKKQAPGSVDEAKDQVRAGVDAAKTKAGEVKDAAQEQGSELAAKSENLIDEQAPESVKEAKDQAKKNLPDSVEQAKALAAQAAEEVKDKAAASVDDAKSKTAENLNDKSYPSSAGSPSHPHTPEDNDRSWAAVAADEHVDTLPGKEPLVLLDKGEAGDTHVPEPGHDSTEPGAISYAAAVQE